jgi:general secretion pathway protein I
MGMEQMAREPRLTSDRGFTLIEVLVALAIVAAALAAGLRASGLLLQGVERQEQTLLAQTCAENAYAEIRAARAYPPVGRAVLPCAQAGMSFEVTLDTMPTPNPSFRRVEIDVSIGGSHAYHMAALAAEY